MVLGVVISCLKSWSVGGLSAASHWGGPSRWRCRWKSLIYFHKNDLRIPSDCIDFYLLTGKLGGGGGIPPDPPRLHFFFQISSHAWVYWALPVAEKISVPVQASLPNKAEYEEHFILEWLAGFFWNCTNLMPVTLSCVSLSASQATNKYFMSPSACSANPWLCRWQGLSHNQNRQKVLSFQDDMGCKISTVVALKYYQST